MRYLWMRVSPDKYEVPEVVARSAGELAMMCGVSKGTIDKCVHRAESNKAAGKEDHGTIYRRVKYTDKEWEE